MKKTHFIIMAAFGLAASAVLAQGTSTSSSDNGQTPAGSNNVIKGAKTTKKRVDGQSTASLSEVAPPAERKYHLTLMNQTNVGQVPMEKGEAKTSGFNRFQVSYDLSANTSVIFREDAPVSYNTKTRETEFHVSDPFIGYTNSKFATLPFGWVVTVQPRVYLPAGEKSRFVTKALGSEALLALADKSLGKFDFEVVGYFQYYNNVQDYSWAYDSKANNFKAVANQDWMSFVEGEIAYNLTPKLALIHDTYLITEQARSTPTASGLQKNILMSETILSYQVMKSFKVMASVEDDAVLDSQNAVQWYKDEDISYNLYLRLSI